MSISDNKTLVVRAARVFCCAIISLLALACSAQKPSLENPEVVYDTYCFACHDTGAAGAPILSNNAYWVSVANDPQRLYAVTIAGRGAMPAKGTCIDCTEEQLRNTVDWMLKHSK